MAVIERMSEAAAFLEKRQVCYRYDIYGRCVDYSGSSRWNDWGRWVALVIVVLGILFVAFLFSCLNNRRRRRRGMTPMYGTGWVPGNNFKPNDQHHAPAPPYSAQPVPYQQTGNTFNSNDGYYGQPQQQYGGQQYGGNPYGGQQSGVELQQPPNSYQRGGEPVYTPPAGPPPAKGDGIIR